MNLTELLKLAGKQGKVIIVSEDGSVKGVFISGPEYQQLADYSVEKQKNQERIKDAIERVNEAILRAQLEEGDEASDITDNRLPSATTQEEQQSSQNAESYIETFDQEINTGKLKQNRPVSTPSSIGSLLTKRAEELFTSKPFGRGEAPLHDLRMEVMDPDFGKSEVIVESDDEEIAPNFDDI